MVFCLFFISQHLSQINISGGFYIHRINQHPILKKTIELSKVSVRNDHPRAFGSTITDLLGDVQDKYNDWIKASGGGGNLANRIPQKFSTAEHLLYDDYPVIGKYH